MTAQAKTAARDYLVTLANGDRVAVAEYGEPAGLPVIGMHGAPASRLMFAVADADCRRLGLRLIAPDRPGIGLTPARGTPHTLASVAAEVESLVDALGLQRFSLIGVSGGGPYAVAAAARLGARATALALVSPVGRLVDAGDDLPMAAGHRWFFHRLPRHSRMLDIGARMAAAAFAINPEAFAGGFARLIGGSDKAVLTDPSVRAAVLAMTTDCLRQGVDGAAADLKNYSRPWGIDLARIKATTLLWQGTDDIIVPAAASFRLARDIPGCHLFSIEGGGHFWVMQHVGEVLEELARNMRAAN